MSFWGAHEFRHNPKNRPPKKIPHEDCTAGIKVGGAGFCINRGSIQQIEDNFRLVSRFQDLAFNIGLNDDVTIGYLMEILLKIELTPINDFHSHSERLGDVKKSDLSRLVCI